LVLSWVDSSLWAWVRETLCNAFWALPFGLHDCVG
jgi:hypothetical protein